MQNNQQRLFLLLILGAIIYFLYTKWDAHKNPAPAPQTLEQTVQSSSSADGQSANDQGVPTLSSGQAEGSVPGAISDYITVLTDVYEIKIKAEGGDIFEVGLRDYPESLEEQDVPFKVMAEDSVRYQISQTGLTGGTHENPNHANSLFTADAKAFEMKEGEDTLVVPLTYEDEASGLTVTKTYRFERGSYTIGFEHRVENNSDQIWVGREYRQIAKKPENKKKGGFGASSFTGSVFSLPENDHKYEKLAFEKMTVKEKGVDPTSGATVEQRRPKQFVGEAGWISMIEQYFVTAWIPGKDKEDTRSTLNIVETLQLGTYKDPSLNTYIIRMYGQNDVVVQPGESHTFESRLFAGPKLKEQLAAAADRLELTLDYGWFSPISNIMLWVLKFFHSFVGNWGWSIVLLTVTVKIALLYFANKGYTSMARMRNVAPKLELIREQYGEDRQKLSEEMMKLYRKEKINPLGGCWPIIIQIPIFISLFWMLMESVELRQAPWILWIKDLSKMDPYFILPLIMGATMFFQQRLNPAPTDPTQAKIIKWMPVVFTFMFMWFASGIVLYWITNNLLTILQQSIIMRRVEREHAKE